MHVPRNTTTWVPGRVLASGGGQAGDPDACDGRLRRECDRVHDGLHCARDPRPPSPHLVAYTASVTHVSQGCPSSLETGVCPAPPWPRVWTLQNVSSAVSCSSPASWSIFSVPLRPRPAACGQTRALGLSGTRELLAPGDRPYILLINNTWSVLTLRRQHPHQRTSKSGSSNYSDLGSLGRGQGQWSPPWHETEQTVFRVGIRR